MPPAARRAQIVRDSTRRDGVWTGIGLAMIVSRDMRRGALLSGWLVVALSALIADQSFAAAALRSFVCEGDSVARLACCCDEGASARPTDRSAGVAAPCCCQVTRVSGPGAPAVAVSNDGAAPIKTFPAVTAPREPATASVAGARWLARSQAPPTPSVPVLLQKQSLLI
jgi:hypothetical protein